MTTVDESLRMVSLVCVLPPTLVMMLGFRGTTPAAYRYKGPVTLALGADLAWLPGLLVPAVVYIVIERAAGSAI